MSGNLPALAPKGFQRPGWVEPGRCHLLRGGPAPAPRPVAGLPAGAWRGGALGVPGRRVLTERREAPSRARIPAALTAGIAAAPLTRAGSRDTAAPC